MSEPDRDDVGGPALPPGTDPVRRVHMVRRFNAPPSRIFSMWADPAELERWFPDRVEGSLAVGARTVLAWTDRRVWWDVLEAESTRRFVFRWPWTPDEHLQTEVRVVFEPDGYGTRMTLVDGPFDLRLDGALDAYAEALEGWGEALTMLRAVADFSTDARHRSR